MKGRIIFRLRINKSVPSRKLENNPLFTRQFERNNFMIYHWVKNKSYTVQLSADEPYAVTSKSCWQERVE